MLDKTLANVTQQIYSPNADASEAMTARLVVMAGPLIGASFVLAGAETVVGRSPDCSIQLGTPGVSRRHCKLTTIKSRIYIEDMGSANGTIVNGRGLQPLFRQELQHGDRIKVLDSEFFFLSPKATTEAGEKDLDVNFGKAAKEASSFLDDFPEILDVRQNRKSK